MPLNKTPSTLSPFIIPRATTHAKPQEVALTPVHSTTLTYSGGTVAFPTVLVDNSRSTASALKGGPAAGSTWFGRASRQPIICCNACQEVAIICLLLTPFITGADLAFQPFMSAADAIIASRAVILNAFVHVVGSLGRCQWFIHPRLLGRHNLKGILLLPHMGLLVHSFVGKYGKDAKAMPGSNMMEAMMGMVDKVHCRCCRR